jgi:hypothetical protein
VRWVDASVQDLCFVQLTFSDDDDDDEEDDVIDRLARENLKLRKCIQELQKELSKK